jgi:uncharacterized membrane protein (UPF0127 family)
MKSQTMTIAGVDLFVLVTETDEERAQGLLSVTRELPHGMGMLITGVTAIHTRGMRFPIDVVWLNEAGDVVDEQNAVAPGQLVECEYPLITIGALEMRANSFVLLRESVGI